MVYSEPETLFPAVRTWLEDVAANGAWFMVIDALNLDQIATQLHQLLPKDRGQVLVTSRDWSILDKLDEAYIRTQKGIHIHVDKLQTSDLYEIFEWHNAEVASAAEEKVNDLLKYLYLPAIVKLTAKWAKTSKTPVPNLHGMIMRRQQNIVSVELPETVYEMFADAHQIFQPLATFHSTEPRLKWQDWPSPAAHLLGELSCLQQDEMDLPLIREEHNKEDRLREVLGSLENCSFIVKGTAADSDRYTMHRTIQELFRRWVVQEMGLKSLLKLHQTALCILVLHYKAMKNAPGAKKTQRPSYHWKMTLMGHFEHFLAFARRYAPTPANVDFKCDDRMVYSVITFTRVYLDEGRFDDAACVLHLTLRFYRGTRYRAPLVRQLCDAYTLPPLASRDKAKWDESTLRLERIVEDFRKGPESDREQEWLCLLALANMYSKTLQPARASAILARLHELNLHTNGIKPYVTRSKVIDFDSGVDLRKLAIHKRVAEARLHTAKASCATSISTTAAYLRKALTAFTEARSAAYTWYEQMDKWAAELDEDIADTWRSMGDAESTRKALSLYKMLLGGYQNEYFAPGRPWSQARIWDLKCKVAYTQLKLSKKNARPERDRTKRSSSPDSGTKDDLATLRSALAFYEKSFGMHEGKHDDHTRVCAHLLVDIYKERRMLFEAKDLETRYSLESASWISASDVVIDEPSWDVRIPISCVVLFLAIMIYQHHRIQWLASQQVDNRANYVCLV